MPKACRVHHALDLGGSFVQGADLARDDAAQTTSTGPSPNT
jgi:hypothetical protein